MHKVRVNRLGGLILPRKSVVRLTDRLDMTGLKQQHNNKSYLRPVSGIVYLPVLYKHQLCMTSCSLSVLVFKIVLVKKYVLKD